MKRHSSWLFAIAWIVTASLASAADATADNATAENTTSAATVDLGGLVEQLGAPEFSERQEASRKLSEAGKSIFPQIEKAAEAGSREVAMRAVEILKRHHTGGDLETKEAAKAALERLAKCGNPAAAQRAADALNPQPAATIQQPAIGGINPAILQRLQQQQLQQLQQLQLQQRGIQIQLGGIAPGQNVVRRTSIRTINGQREIEVQVGDRNTKIKDGANGGIEAEITEKVNGKETTRKIEAKDLEDLKKKDADVARIYEMYNRVGRGIQIGAMPGGALPGGALPGGALPVPAVPPPESVKRMIESIERSIERAKTQLPNDPIAQQRIDSLERTKKRYQDMLPRDEAKPAEAAQKAVDEARRAAESALRDATEAARKAAEPRDPFAP
jgi:hypothetical protein